MDNVEIVRNIIRSNLFMTLATSANNIPWSCPVFFAADKDLNLYFVSYNNSLHVKNIQVNPQLAVSIFDSHAIPGTGTTQAVYISGICKRVLGEQLPFAIEVVYSKRFPDSNEREGKDLSVEHFSLPDSVGRTDHIYKIEGITWEDFFKTLPFKLGKDCLITGTKQTFCTNNTHTLKFYINAKLDPEALERQLNDGDQLLISYGVKNDSEVENQLQLIPKIK